MEKVEVPPIHNHPLLPFTRFSYKACKGCGYVGYIYGGYHCNELGCESVFHKECADPLPEINHSSHPDHPLKLLINVEPLASCSQCPSSFENGYLCSICDFKLDFRCATRLPLEFILEESTVHEHPIQLSDGTRDGFVQLCKTCKWGVFDAVHYKCMDEEASRLEKLLPFHEHPLIPFTRFEFTKCKGCYSTDEDNTSFISKHPGCSYIYGGHRCNEPGCDVVFHEECAKPLPEIDHPYHPVHPLKLILLHTRVSNCSFCGEFFSVGYRCNKCDFQLDLICARRPAPLVLAENSYLHEHPLQLSHEAHETLRDCKGCGHQHNSWKHFYTCHQCEFFISLDCIDHNSPEAYHTSHPQHPLKSLRYEVPGYADKKCLLCREEPLCCVCNSRCKLPFVRTLPEDGADLYFCSLECEKKIDQERFEF
ncbi:unnamed protein product [Arabidopsis thaliana]|uniref:(thale cress) hypothetical protein n=1 Tax=Arabidopsis thaliana TaxID=3702 RepID=A0A7G2EDJ9_ARATH|nr:unnamed protein product [Arabidopsis thaliana]